MRQSQYTDPYLDYTAHQRPVTIGTFLGRVLHGKQKKWSGRYRDALQRSLDTLEREGKVRRVLTKTGSTAYVRTDESQRASVPLHKGVHSRNPHAPWRGIVDAEEDIEVLESDAGRPVTAPPGQTPGSLGWGGMELTPGGSIVLRNPDTIHIRLEGIKYLVLRETKASATLRKAAPLIAAILDLRRPRGKRHYVAYRYRDGSYSRAMPGRFRVRNPEPTVNIDRSGFYDGTWPRPSAANAKALFDRRMPLANPHRVTLAHGTCPGCDIGIVVPGDISSGQCPSCGMDVRVAHPRVRDER